MYDRPETKPCCEGNELEPVFEYKVDDKGEKDLVKVGETNVREKIQEFKDECDVKQILARATVDPSVLHQREVFYADVTAMPHSLAEAQQMITEIKKDFEKMSPEIKEKFDYSAERYIAEFGSKEWAEAMGATQEEVKAIKEAAKAAEPVKAEKGEVINESEQ